MKLFDKILNKTVKKLADDAVTDVTNTLWGVKAVNYVEFNKGERGVELEDGTIVREQTFITKELMRQRNRDIYQKRAMLGIGTFILVGNTYKLVEKVVKK